MNGQRRVLVLTSDTGAGHRSVSNALVAAARARGDDLELVDIDPDPELVRRYGVRVPVVALDGKELFDYEVPVDLLRAWLARVGAD